MADIDINVNDNWKQHVAVGGETSFVYDFPVTDSSYLKVLRQTSATADPVEQVISTNYTVNGVGAEGGGSITLVSPSSASAGEVWTLYLDIPEERLGGYQTAGSFRALVVNAEFDKYMQILQQLRRDFDRTIVLDPADPAASLTLPLKSARASRNLAFDSNGDLVASAEIAEAVVSAYMETVLDDADAETARATLEVYDAALDIALYHFGGI
ncbi:MAG: hypothetical protein QNJ94_18585 [Alphaproteobacteria bacterium]|nr:hypothetical protein [Alphaproteobacteria bacterium]